MLRRLFAIVLVPLLLLTSCAQIPRSSEVKFGPDLDPQNATEPIYYSPTGPYPGQTQLQVMSGFFTAGTGPQNDYSTAREYLTSQFRGKWSPNDEVLVQQGGIQVVIDSTGTATVTLQVQARVDANGMLYTFNEPITRQLTYHLISEDLQWRIDDGPNLTILNKPVFDVLFSDYSLYFFDRSHSNLVPEKRWFPARASTATRLVNALLDGPSDWLAPAVDRPLPRDVKLAIEAVTVQNGIALINLNAQANSLANETLRLFKTQAQETLRQLPLVNDVSIYLDGLPKVLTNVSWQQNVQPATSPITLSNGQLSYLAGNIVSGSQSLIRQTQATDFALNLDTRELVMLSSTGLHWAKLGQIDRELVTLDARSALLSPKFDRTGKIWAFSKLAGNSISIVSRTGSSTVKADWLANYERLSFSISEEGSRLAVVATNRFETRIFVAAIIRDDTGTPIELGAPLSFSPAQGRPLQLTWLDEDDMAVAYSNEDQSNVSVYRATLGGTTKAFGSVASVKSLLASPSGNSVYLVTEAGDLYLNEGYGFNLISTGVLAAHLPY